MIEEISTNLYKVEIPLPRSPLRSTNSYIIKGADRNLIVDTGMNRKVCEEAMRTAIERLDIDLAATDFFITHLHADHIGLVGALSSESSKIYFNQPDADRIYADGTWEDMIEFGRISGFPEGMLQDALNRHPGYKYGAEMNFTFTILEDGDTISVGDYTFECVQTPGHTWGHMCLYEPDKKLFLAGDHILIDITPNIQLWSTEENTLAQYLASLDKVYELDIELVLPGHRRLIENCRERIRELQGHHRDRLDEIKTILENGSGTAYQVASKMQWDIDSDSWEEFPVPQQWFATGEAIAHLKHLEDTGDIVSESRNGKIVHSPA